MPEIHTLTLTNTAGAAVTSTSVQTVFAAGEKVATNDDSVAGHGIGVHAAPVTKNGSSTVIAEGEPVNRKGDADSCGHERNAGVTNVFVGG
jgi:uncharacterized Zn-binding protein involved in type VI secretion|tara:strand:- start:1417 stop:1689 length:273 start_codon:yes stop_codon:yes gene_type:complete